MRGLAATYYDLGSVRALVAANKVQVRVFGAGGAVGGGGVSANGPVVANCCSATPPAKQAPQPATPSPHTHHAPLGPRPTQIAGLILEPVVGNSGFIVPTKEFLQGLREITQQEGALLCFDEVRVCVCGGGFDWVC